MNSVSVLTNYTARIYRVINYVECTVSLMKRIIRDVGGAGVGLVPPLPLSPKLGGLEDSIKVMVKAPNSWGRG